MKRIIELDGDFFIRDHGKGARRWKLMRRTKDWPHEWAISGCDTKTDALLIHALLVAKTKEDKEAPLAKLHERLAKQAQRINLPSSGAWQRVAMYWQWVQPPQCFRGDQKEWIGHMRAARGLP